MKNENQPTKEELLAQIDRLLDIDKSGESTIDPALLKFLDIAALESILNGLMERAGELSDDDKEWLSQFRKYE